MIFERPCRIVLYNHYKKQLRISIACNALKSKMAATTHLDILYNIFDIGCIQKRQLLYNNIRKKAEWPNASLCIKLCLTWIGKHAFHYFIIQITTVLIFMIITIPRQVESFKNRYCTEQNNEHVQHYGIPFYRRSLVGHTEYEYLIILRSKIQKQDKQLCHFKEDNITVFKIPPQLVYYADFYIDKDISKHAT